MNRAQALARLRATAESGGVVAGAGAGTGLGHGGPIAEPEDTQYVLDHTTGVAGFFGASSMERLPTEVAITENMRRFKRISRAATAAS